MPLIKGVAFLLVCMLALGVVRGSELRRRFPFELWIIIASALTLSQALTNSGLVALLADALHDNLAQLGPYAATDRNLLWYPPVLTEAMTNNAAAALSFPDSLSAWRRATALSPMPFVMTVAFGASASFLTPYGYNTNLMVQNLGGYELRDYFRALACPLSIVYSGTSDIHYSPGLSLLTGCRAGLLRTALSDIKLTVPFAELGEGPVVVAQQWLFKIFLV